MEKKVSIIVPTYKRSDYLERAIESLLNQSYSNIEIIVVDDNDPSTDYRKTTEEKMKKYSSNSKIKYFKNKENMGGALSRNEGINEATGDYITFLDDDDEYLKDKILNQVEFMNGSSCHMSFTNLRYVNENQVVVDYREFSNLKNFDKESLLKYHIMRHLTGTPTFMYRAQKLKEIGGFEDVRMGQEFFLMLKSIEKDLKICYIDICDVLAYRHNEGGISQGTNKIEGEKELYNHKKKYFHIFTLREQMFIRFRHFAVMMVAYMRNKQYIKAIGSGVQMFVSSPFDVVKEGSRFVFNIVSNRTKEA